MDRRTFLLSSLAVPLAFDATQSNDCLAKDPKKTLNFSQNSDDPKATLWQLSNDSGAQMMGYVLKTREGHTIVFDGGWAHNADELLELINGECGGKVDAWFLTHAHSDHCNALVEILTNRPNSVKIQNLYYNFPPQEWINENESYCKEETDAIFEGLAKFPSAQKPAPNQVFEFGSLRIECLNDFDLSIKNNAINNSTITYRLDVGDKSILILGDLGYEGGDRLLEAQRDKLSCEFCQMAHHGQQGVRRNFYEAVKPTYTLWPTPDWLWRNDAGGGDGTGPFKTCDTRCWAAELGVKDYYVSKDGLIKLTF